MPASLRLTNSQGRSPSSCWYSATFPGFPVAMRSLAGDELTLQLVECVDEACVGDLRLGRHGDAEEPLTADLRRLALDVQAGLFPGGVAEEVHAVAGKLAIAVHGETEA